MEDHLLAELAATSSQEDFTVVRSKLTAFRDWRDGLRTLEQAKIALHKATACAVCLAWEG